MRTSIIIFFITSVVIALTVFTFSERDKQDPACCGDLTPLGACLSSLEAAIDNVEDVNPKFSSQLAVASSGWIRMSYQDINYKIIEQNSKWNANYLRECSKYGISDDKISLLTSAMKNVLPDDPIPPLTDCMAGLLTYTTLHEHHAGPQAGFEMGVAVGKTIGNVGSILTFLYKDLEKYQEQNFEKLYEMIYAQALDTLETNQQAIKVDQKQDVNALTSKCDIFDIDSTGLLTEYLSVD